MKPFVSAVLTLIIAIAVNVSGISTAEANGQSDSSFKQNFDYNQPLRHNTAESQQLLSPVKQRNAELKQQLSNNGGVSSLVGGLAVGGLFGALLFGGAFEYINIFDVIILTILAIVLCKLAAPKKRQGKQNRPTVSFPISADGTAPFPSSNDHYREPTPVSPPSRRNPDSGRRSSDKKVESDSFVEGAEALFRRLQKAWDEGDLADIRQFTTDHVFAEIQDQHHQRAHRTPAKILSLKTELLNTNRLDSKQEAIVLFEAQLNEEDRTTSHIHEVWHFTRPANSTQSTWFLDGIQQVQ